MRRLNASSAKRLRDRCSLVPSAMTGGTLGEMEHSAGRAAAQARDSATRIRRDLILCCTASCTCWALITRRDGGRIGPRRERAGAELKLRPAYCQVERMSFALLCIAGAGGASAPHGFVQLLYLESLRAAHARSARAGILQETLEKWDEDRKRGCSLFPAKHTA